MHVIMKQATATANGWLIILLTKADRWDPTSES